MSKPTVCAILLTADRPELAKRAVDCFLAQTYPAKQLLIYDTGTDDAEDCPGDYPLVIWIPEESRGRTIGELRNAANSHVAGVEVDLSADTSKDCGADILIHFDDDDWSHPNRIAEQVTLLQSSGADCVGYNEMLFWREKQEPIPSRGPDDIEALRRNHQLRPGEAWLYTNRNPTYALGTSLCYWRKAWERNPFKATSRGEDLDFCRALKCVGVPASPSDFYPEPRMIARIHGGNTMMDASYTPEKMREAPDQWRRAPGWDAYAGSVME